jgi:DNA-binding IclR family transcriptional regulator
MQATGETVHLGILDGREAVVIDKIDSFRSIRMASSIGFRSPLHCTGVGKVLSASMPSSKRAALWKEQDLRRYTPNTITDPLALETQLKVIAAQGYALDLEEKEQGLRCVAAPIRDHTGNTVAAISVSAPSNRMTEESLPEIVRVVLSCALKISEDIGYNDTADSRNAA